MTCRVSLVSRNPLVDLQLQSAAFPSNRLRVRSLPPSTLRLYLVLVDIVNFYFLYVIKLVTIQSVEERFGYSKRDLGLYNYLMK